MDGRPASDHPAWPARRSPTPVAGLVGALAAVDLLTAARPGASARVSLEGAVGHLLEPGAPRWLTSDRLAVKVDGAITEIVFDHPPINVYDVATRDALCEVLGAIIADPDVRVVVFTATGDHFSAGADLKEFGTAPSLFAMRDARWGRDVWGLLRAVPVPMVASMQGNAVGFGFELALQCDVRVAADDCVRRPPRGSGRHVARRWREPDPAPGRGDQRRVGRGHHR